MQLTLRNGNSVTVRRLATGDRETLQRFHAGLSNRSRQLFTPHAYDDATVDTAITRSEDGDDAVFVAVDDQGQFVAYLFLWYCRRQVSLLGIGIADDWQGLGLGRQLMVILIEEGRRLGMAGIELTTMPDNAAAFALYQKVGFKYLRDVENQVGDGRITIEHCMFLPLQDGAEPMTEAHAPPM